MAERAACTSTDGTTPAEATSIGGVAGGESPAAVEGLVGAVPPVDAPLPQQSRRQRAAHRQHDVREMDRGAPVPGVPAPASRAAMRGSSAAPSPRKPAITTYVFGH